MPIARHSELPDSDVACREIGEAVLQLGPVIEKQARAHERAVRPFLERGGLRGAARVEEARRLIATICSDSAGRNWGLAGFEVRGWDSEVWSGAANRFFYPPGEPHGNGYPGPVHTALHPAHEALRQAKGKGLPRMDAADLGPVLTLLHRGLIELADGLPGTIPVPAVPPAPHPPEYARLHEDAFAEEVTENLARCINDALSLYEAVRRSDWPGLRPESWQNHHLHLYTDPVLHERFPEALDDFAPTTVAGGYYSAVERLYHLPELTFQRRRNSVWDPRSFPEVRELSRRLIQQVYSAHIAIAVNYLAEVQERMPRYLELSEQGKRRDSVTVHGNVGAINSQVHNSQLSVASTLTSIGATIQAVADRGEQDTAAALRALTETIQHAPELTEDQRAELLDNVADVADAAAAPDEPRRLARARAAMAMITTAAGASTQLAQAIDTWHQVAGQLF
ncbi:hypothetical protein ACFRLW_25570 [Streptomyces sp. NPDC056728]